MLEQWRGHKSWHFQISFYQWYSRGDQRWPTPINIPININLGWKARIASDRNELTKNRDRGGANGGGTAEKKTSRMPGTNLILDAAGNWRIEKFMANRISKGVRHPSAVAIGVRILALFFCYFRNSGSWLFGVIIARSLQISVPRRRIEFIIRQANCNLSICNMENYNRFLSCLSRSISPPRSYDCK